MENTTLDIMMVKCMENTTRNIMMGKCIKNSTRNIMKGKCTENTTLDIMKGKFLENTTLDIKHPADHLGFVGSGLAPSGLIWKLNSQLSSLIYSQPHLVTASSTNPINFGGYPCWRGDQAAKGSSVLRKNHDRLEVRMSRGPCQSAPGYS